MDKAIQLLKEFQEFSEKGNKADFGLFGEWLKQKHAPESNLATDKAEVNDAGLDAMAGYLLGGLGSYADVWIKLSYQTLPLVSVQDYGIIKTVQYVGNPTKKMLVEKAVMERSTCIEAIKRLVREGLLKEEVDKKDRRLRRVRLTAKGKKLIPLVDEKMKALGTLLVGNLTEVEKKAIFTPLKKLLDFHEHLYHEVDRDQIKKVYQI
ncbi:MAG: MarR family winged helix-turn-helix transcriptional regulator [Bacteroidota bacterium]